MPERVTLTVGNGGWALFQLDGGQLYVRFTESEGRLRPAELYVPQFSGARTVRTIPFGDLEAWVNEPETRAEVLGGIRTPAPLLSTAITYFSVRLGKRPTWGWSWADEMLASQQPDRFPGLTAAKPRRVTSVELRETDPDVIDARLDIPAARPYGDDFYRSVAAVYSELAPIVRDPANRIADANGVAEITRVHRWIKEARRRGFLAAGQRGKRG